MHITKLLTGLLITSCLLTANAAIDQNHNDDHRDDELENEGAGMTLTLNPEQYQMLGLETVVLERREIQEYIYAHGEIQLNRYRSAILAPRVDAQIVKQHVSMGQLVAPESDMVTLSSIELAQAQSDYIVSFLDWHRESKLGRGVLADKTLQETKTRWQLARTKLQALGLSENQIVDLELTQSPNGLFTMKSPIIGTIIEDDFIEGQFVEAGTSLFTISDESSLWIEVALTPQEAMRLPMGGSASFDVEEQKYSANISQIYHRVDELTRTQKVRLTVNNSRDTLHPGQFVNIALELGKSVSGKALPKRALVKAPDGDVSVFVERATGKFELVEVELLREFKQWVFVSGLELGTTVVTEGAFFLSSELAKSGFDPHNH